MRPVPAWIRLVPGLLLWCCAQSFAGGLQVSPRVMAWKPAPGQAEAPTSTGWENGAIRMPFVSSPDEPEVAARINETLYLAVIGSAAPAQPGRTFTPLGTAGIDGTTELDFKVARNDGRILDLHIDGEGCGAYCETYQQTYAFDARTGRTLTVQDLLTPQGQGTVVRRMRAERVRRYTAQIKALKQSLATLNRQRPRGQKPGIDLGDTEDRIALNEDCLARERERANDPEALRDFGYFRMALPADRRGRGLGMAFTSGRCSNHAMRALDDVDEVTLTLAPGELAPLLTPYGAALLLGRDAAPAPVAPWGQVLHGQIDTAPVTVHLGRLHTDGSLRGRYFYDKYRQPLLLGGRVTAAKAPGGAQTLTLEERIREGESAQAVMTLTVTPEGRLEGQWRGRAGDGRVLLLPMALR